MPILPTVTSGSVRAAVANDSPDHDGSSGSGHGGGSGLGEWSPLIGIVTAIVGNVLIALALNVQRYSHIQLQRKRAEAQERAKETLKRGHGNHRNGYGAIDVRSNNLPIENRVDVDAEDGGGGDGDDDNDDDDATETHPLAQSFQSNGSNWTQSSDDDAPQVTSSYLKSPSWWLGQVLMTVGEMGNFLAYGFAPASIVSPLGVVALISNCVIAPIFFGEIFRKRDFWGVVIAVGGAITVVLSAKGGETKLDPHDVWDAITTMEFEIYLGVTTFLIIVLMWASPRYGNKTILIDLGLVGLFGGYTALTTKGVSSMLSSTLFKAFATPVTYGLVIVLLGTAVMQVRYVNKALQRFDSTQVIPIQFVLFTLSVIIGSAVLYRDFERTAADQAAKFIGGCLLTFFGVFLITSGRPRQGDGDRLSDDENIEETIGLRNQEGYGPYNSSAGQPRGAPTQTRSASSSRRSSHTSRGSFSRGGRPFRNQPIDTPPTRRADQSISKSVLPTPTGASPLLNNPWKNSVEDQSFVHPGLSQAVSTDSVPTIESLVSVAASEPLQSSMGVQSLILPPSSPERPTTPRPPTLASRAHSHQRHYSSAFISPSPLSSTVSAVVSDTLLAGDDSPVKRRSIRPLRSTPRSSLFVSQGDGGNVGISDSLLVANGEQHQTPNEYEPPSLKQEITRGRARSLSNTLERFFGRKERGRRDSNSEIGGNTSNPVIDTLGHG
ncbi:putative NIPA-like protein 2 [Rosellinia necatrix]|uniref:Putative NIPA-like protein 2 n=1 Tax=Rosellinia necatrix TaxID=77044 RepID=A0A1W2TLV5_ROSNE|nr:putative NIPA-like protein 2 [Rosellinia necatrix]